MTVEAICWLVIGAVLMGVMWLTSSERDLFVARRDWPTARRLKRARSDLNLSLLNRRSK